MQYEGEVRERWSTFVTGPLRDRLVWRRDQIADVAWHRVGTREVRVRGARLYRPFLGEAVVPVGDAAAEAGDLVFAPEEAGRWVGLGTYRVAAHPTLADREASYAFALGDTLEVALPDGRRVAALEVRVTPRGPAGRLEGSLWVDCDSGALVRERYRVHGGG